MINFKRFVHIEVLQATTDSGMLYLFSVIHRFHLRPEDTILRTKERRHSTEQNITISVYSRCKDSPAVFLIPLRIIGTSAKKRYTIRGFYYDQFFISRIMLLEELTFLPPARNISITPNETHAACSLGSGSVRSPPLTK